MRRLLVFCAAASIGFAQPVAGRADGMPSCPCPPQAKVHVKVKTVHRVRHRVRVARAPAVFALPGPYDLRQFPPPPIDSAYEPATVEYFRDPSVTGYWPGSEPGYVEDTAGADVAGVYYHRTGWPGTQRPQLPPPPAVDNFPFRQYAGPVVTEYDGAIGEYVQLSRRDAARAIAVLQDKPVPLWPAPPR